MHGNSAKAGIGKIALLFGYSLWPIAREKRLIGFLMERGFRVNALELGIGSSAYPKPSLDSIRAAAKAYATELASPALPLYVLASSLSAAAVRSRPARYAGPRGSRPRRAHPRVSAARALHAAMPTLLDEGARRPGRCAERPKRASRRIPRTGERRPSLPQERHQTIERRGRLWGFHRLPRGHGLGGRPSPPSRARTIPSSRRLCEGPSPGPA